MPTSSVVVASLRDRAALEAMLRGFAPGCEERDIELVVARNCSADEYHALETAFPKILFMPAPDHSTVRQLRAIGLSAADGDIVTLVDDSMTLDARWVAELPPVLITGDESA
jgi:hypothetical protein